MAIIGSIYGEKIREKSNILWDHCELYNIFPLLGDSVKIADQEEPPEIHSFQ